MSTNSNFGTTSLGVSFLACQEGELDLLQLIKAFGQSLKFGLAGLLFNLDLHNLNLVVKKSKVLGCILQLCWQEIQPRLGSVW